MIDVDQISGVGRREGCSACVLFINRAFLDVNTISSLHYKYRRERHKYLWTTCPASRFLRKMQQNMQLSTFIKFVA